MQSGITIWRSLFRFALIWGMIFLTPDVFAGFRYIQLRNGSLTRSLIDQTRQNKLIILEPISSAYYLAWIPESLDRLPDSIAPHISLVENTTFEPWFSGHNEACPKILDGQYCFWFLDSAPGSAPGHDQIQKTGAHILHSSTIKMSRSISYNVIGVLCSQIDTDKVLAWNNLRCFYKESGEPVPDDELSVLSTIVGHESLEETSTLASQLNKLEISGSRIRVGIIDTGCDKNSNPSNHPDLNTQIREYYQYQGSPGFDYIGHGTHIAGIIAGSGQANIRNDAGWNKGCGFSARFGLTISDALLAYPFPPESGFAGLACDIASTGAQVCNNSWTDGQGTSVGYNPNCAIWDSIVHDALPNDHFQITRPLTVIFSAGNKGPNEGTLTSPKEAKNVIVVGATGKLSPGENPVIIDSSSRGPCADGRNSPLICSTGKEIVSCWPHSDYNESSGTSQAAAHTTGMVGLIRDWWLTHANMIPSPALTKAILVLSSKPISESFPAFDSGWGLIQLTEFLPKFPTSAVQDQVCILQDVNQRWECIVNPIDPMIPIDIVLAWSDVPGSPGTSPALVNDLDLLVQTPSHVYFGNDFEGYRSLPDGTPDRINNLERIRVMVNSNQALTVSVVANALRGDGYWNNLDPTDQAFSIAIKNGTIIGDKTEIHVPEKLVGSRERVSIKVTGRSLVGKRSINVRVMSRVNPDGIVISALPTFPGSLEFEAEFITGSQGQNSIETHPSDSLKVELVDFNSVPKEFIRVDGTAPELETLEFIQLTAQTATLSAVFNDICSAVLYYKPLEEEKWAQCESQVWDSNHVFKLADLLPITQYVAYFSATDKADNNYCSEEFIGLTRWTTNSSRVHYHRFMNTDPGFIQLDNAWEWGIPEGNGFPADPTAGKTGNHVLGYNLSGNYGNFIEPAHAISSSIDCSESGNYFLGFHRWLNIETGLFDYAVVSVKNSENQWVDLWSNPYYDLREYAWSYQRFDVTSWAEGNPSFQYRFTQGQTDGAITRSGWNIDDIIIEQEKYALSTPTPLIVATLPTVSLKCSDHVFRFGDRFTLTALVFADGKLENAGLAVTASVGNMMYYFPQWRHLPDWITINQPNSGRYPVFVADFDVPVICEDTPIITFSAVLFDPDNPSNFSLSESIPVRFLSE